VIENALGAASSAAGCWIEPIVSYWKRVSVRAWLVPPVYGDVWWRQNWT